MDRATALRRAGLAALLPLAGAPAALAGDGGRPFPVHPRWRFVFVSHRTLDPLLVATQFGAQDACALVGCDFQWAGSPRGSAIEALKALRVAIGGKVGGIVLSRPEPPLFETALGEAARAGIPVVGFDVGGQGEGLAYVGQSHFAAGGEAASTLVGRGGVGEAVLLLAPAQPTLDVRRRLDGALSALSRLGASFTTLTAATPTGYRTAIEKAFTPGTRFAILALEEAATVAAATFVRERELRGTVRAAGFDLLPNHYDLVDEQYLDFAVDQQPYLLGFLPVVLLFMSRISNGLVEPVDVQIPPRLLTKETIAGYLQTKSRFEGSSSRHRYPPERA